MKSLSPAHLLFAFLTCVPLSPRAVAGIIPDDQIRSILQKCVDEESRAPGLVVGVIENGKQRIVCYGKSDSPNSKLDGDTVFEIGSITKTFTAILLALAEQRGKLDLNAPIKNYLPSSVKVPDRNGKEITLLQLATHTSGLPRLPSNMKPKDPANPYSDYTVEQLYSFLGDCTLQRDPGAKYEYSNLGMGLVGHIAALNAGTNYEALLTGQICQPLKMKSTRITLDETMKERLARGHQGERPVKNWDLPVLAGAGAIRSTLNDMLKYIAANMDTNDSPLSVAIQKTQVIQAEAGSAEMSIGMAWHVRKKLGSEVVWHNGGTGGYHSFCGFDRSKRQGVVVLSNSAQDIDDIGWHLLNPEYKLVSRLPLQVAKIDYSVYDIYAGEYQFVPGVRLTVNRDGDHLMAQLTGQQKFEVYPESETKFFYKVVDAQLTFTVEDGKARNVILHQNGRDQKATKVK